MPITRGNVDLWWGTVSDLESAGAYFLSVLSKCEKTRMENYRCPRRGRMFGLIRGWVRVVLTAYLSDEFNNVADRVSLLSVRGVPAQLQIGNQPNGKPVLIREKSKPPPERIEFNLSHSDEHFLLAVTQGSKVGVDLECIRNIDPMDTIARMFFSKDDYEYLRKITDEPEKRLRFFELWTRLEARYKAFGDQEGHQSVKFQPIVWTWEPSPGYVASLTSEHRFASVRWIPWEGIQMT